MSKTISQTKLYNVIDECLPRAMKNEDRQGSIRPKSGSSISSKGNIISARRNSFMLSGAWSAQDKENMPYNMGNVTSDNNRNSSSRRKHTKDFCMTPEKSNYMVPINTQHVHQTNHHAMPLIYGSHVTMDSPDPLSKFHEGPGPVLASPACYAPVMSTPNEKSTPVDTYVRPPLSPWSQSMKAMCPISPCGYSPTHITTSNNNKPDMPWIYGGNVTMPSPDPLSKFHETCIPLNNMSPIPETCEESSIIGTPFSKWPHKNSNTSDIANLTISQSPTKIPTVSIHESANIPSLSSLAISPDEKCPLKRYTRNIVSASSESQVEDSKHFESRENEILDNQIPMQTNHKNRIRAIQELTKLKKKAQVDVIAGVFPLVPQPPPPHLSISGTNPTDAAKNPRLKRMVVCGPPKIDLLVDLNVNANYHIEHTHSPDSIAATLSPSIMSQEPDCKSQQQALNAIMPSKLGDDFTEEVTIVDDCSLLPLTRAATPQDHRRSKSCPVIDKAAPIKTLMLLPKFQGDKLFRRGGRMLPFFKALECLPEEKNPAMHSFPHWMLDNLADIKASLRSKGKRTRTQAESTIEQVSSKLEPYLTEELSFQLELDAQNDYVARYTRRFKRVNLNFYKLFNSARILKVTNGC